MTDELYDLYQTNEDFKHYVDAWCQKNNQGIFEAFRYKMVAEYAKCLKEAHK